MIPVKHKLQCNEKVVSNKGLYWFEINESQDFYFVKDLKNFNYYSLFYNSMMAYNFFDKKVAKEDPLTSGYLSLRNLKGMTFLIPRFSLMFSVKEPIFVKNKHVIVRIDYVFDGEFPKYLFGARPASIYDIMQLFNNPKQRR